MSLILGSPKTEMSYCFRPKLIFYDVLKIVSELWFCPRCAIFPRWFYSYNSILGGQQEIYETNTKPKNAIINQNSLFPPECTFFLPPPSPYGQSEKETKRISIIFRFPRRAILEYFPTLFWLKMLKITGVSLTLCLKSIKSYIVLPQIRGVNLLLNCLSQKGFFYLALVTIKPKHWIGCGWAVIKCWWRFLVY